MSTVACVINETQSLMYASPSPPARRFDCPEIPEPRPGDHEIRAALERVSGSTYFRGSLRLTAFLRHVVERQLAGRGAEIKSYTIAVEALGRESSFEPEADPIVRVEAVRLRHALALYYGGAGSGDPISIDLPRGSYVPRFRRRGGAADPDGLQALLGRLATLHRELEAITADIERTWKRIAQSQPPAVAGK